MVVIELHKVIVDRIRIELLHGGKHAETPYPTIHLDFQRATGYLYRGEAPADVESDVRIPPTRHPVGAIEGEEAICHYPGHQGQRVLPNRQRHLILSEEGEDRLTRDIVEGPGAAAGEPEEGTIEVEDRPSPDILTVAPVSSILQPMPAGSEIETTTALELEIEVKRSAVDGVRGEVSAGIVPPLMLSLLAGSQVGDIAAHHHILGDGGPVPSVGERKGQIHSTKPGILRRDQGETL